MLPAGLSLYGLARLAWALPGDVSAEAPAGPPEASAGPSSPDGGVPEPAAPGAPELTPPKLRQDVQPRYPQAAQKEGLAAVVVLEIDIDALGRVEDARVVEPATPAGYGFDEAALEAARLLEFEPAREGENAVAVTLHYRFRFLPDVTPQAQPETASAGASDAGPPAIPPTGQLWGALQERGTRQPLSGVKVTVFRGEGTNAEGYETETDVEGKFRLDALGIGNWRVLADPDGYYPLRTTEKIAKDSRTDVSYSIERSSYNPYDVLVDAKRVRREVSQVSIDARQAERIPGTFGDVLAVVQNFPGVARTGGFDPAGGGVVIRGSAAEDSRVMVDNIDVPLLYHFGNVRSVLPVGMIESVQFYPGNFSVEYGRATGGIINVNLKDLKPKKFGGYADINLFDSSVYLEAPITDELSIAVGGRRSYIDLVLGAALPDTEATVAAPRYYDLQALASYRPSPAHQLQGFFFLSDDRFEVLFDNPVAAGAEAVISGFGLNVNFYRGIAEYKYIPNDKFESELRLSFGRDRRGLTTGELFNNTRLHQGQLRETARYELSDTITLRGGVDYLFQRYRQNAQLPEAFISQEGDGNSDTDLSSSRLTNTSQTYHSTAAFAELELRLWPGALLIPGVRVDQFSRTNESAVSPRFTVRQKLDEQWTLKGGVGLFAQEPTFDDTAVRVGNPDLGLEHALHYSAGFEYQPLPDVNLDVTGFYKTLYDLVSRTDRVASLDGEAQPLNLSNGGVGRVLGLELSARHELTDKLYGWATYTLSRAERSDDGARGYRLFDFDQTHILTLIGSYRLPRNWEISARFRYVTGNLHTPVIGAVYDADADQYKGINGRVNSGRADAFHQLDVRIDKRWVFEKWMLNAYLDVQNVYNRANVDGVEYNYDFSESESDQGLPIIPVVGLRGEF
ncbi:MAG: TonB-dependent receptor [Deltaproteobacteria bacterium]